ncbi:MAG: hypothetical protein ACM309_08565 [Bacillota bacterium]
MAPYLVADATRANRFPDRFNRDIIIISRVAVVALRGRRVP